MITEPVAASAHGSLIAALRGQIARLACLQDRPAAAVVIQTARCEWRRSLLLQKHFRFDASLFQDGAQRSFWHIARMVWDGGVAVGCRLMPDLMTTGRLTMELKAERF
jgi:hypothetical protein